LPGNPVDRFVHLPWNQLDSIRDLLAEPIRQVLSDVSCEKMVDRFLRDHKYFSREQRQLSKEILYGVSIWRRRLFHLLQNESPTPNQLIDALKQLPHAAVSADYRINESIPNWLAVELENAVGTEAPDLARALNVPGPKCLRVNRLVTTRIELKRQLLEHHIETTEGTLSEDALLVTSDRPNFLGLPSTLQSAFEVQDEGSQALSFLLNLSPADTVFDACSGAGGKSLHLKSLVGNAGHVHAYDVDSNRLERLRHRAARAKSPIQIHHQWPANASFAHVFVDAPCSELGALRRGPDARWRINQHEFARFPPMQLGILSRAATCVAAKGLLLYATCTFRAAENEHVVATFLKTHHEFSLLKTFTTFPHRQIQSSLTPDSFYGALLKRA
jgi:16S rRNA (cytosine967-C5)-methyltransferase